MASKATQFKAPDGYHSLFGLTEIPSAMSCSCQVPLSPLGKPLDAGKIVRRTARDTPHSPNLGQIQVTSPDFQNRNPSTLLEGVFAPVAKGIYSLWRFPTPCDSEILWQNPTVRIVLRQVIDLFETRSRFATDTIAVAQAIHPHWPSSFDTPGRQSRKPQVSPLNFLWKLR